MAYIHQKGYTHRDLKSQNILYDEHDGRAKVADFGMSRACSERDTSPQETGEEANPDTGGHFTVLMTGAAGTAPWMAPELCQNEVAIDNKLASVKTNSNSSNRASLLASFANFQAEHKVIEYGASVDVYAFGITMWELLSHRIPWYDRSSAHTIYATVASGGRPTIPAEAAAVVPADWCELMQACWAQSACDRPSFPEVCATLVCLCRSQAPD